MSSPSSPDPRQSSRRLNLSSIPSQALQSYATLDSSSKYLEHPEGPQPQDRELPLEQLVLTQEPSLSPELHATHGYSRVFSGIPRDSSALTAITIATTVGTSGSPKQARSNPGLTYENFTDLDGDGGGIAEHLTHTVVIARRPQQSPRLSLSPLPSPHTQSIDVVHHRSPLPIPVRSEVKGPTPGFSRHRWEELPEPQLKDASTEEVAKKAGEKQVENRASLASGEYPPPETYTGSQHSGGSLRRGSAPALGESRVPLGESVPEITAEPVSPLADRHLSAPDTLFVTGHRPAPLELLNGFLAHLKLTGGETPLLKVAESSPKLSSSPTKDTPFMLKYLPDDGYTLPYSLSNNLVRGTAEIYYQDGGSKAKKKSTKPSKRVALNPFDVLYYPERKHRHTPSQQSSKLPYQLVQHGVVVPAVHGHRRVELELAPVISILSKDVNRLGLIISRLATLRNRGLIKKRNKIGKRQKQQKRQKPESEAKKSSRRSSWWRFPMFTFPIRRQRLLKYKPVVTPSKPDYSTDSELAKVLEASNAFHVVKDLLPPTFDFYHYTQLFRANPLLFKTRHEVTWENDGHCHPVTQEKRPMQILAPLKDSFLKNGQPMEISRINLYDAVYLRYRQQVFLGGYRVVPKFQQLFPNDTQLLTSKELDRVNRTMLLEVLLRRTIAAKIGYRLKREQPEHGSSNISMLSSRLAPKTSRQGPPIQPPPPPLARDNGSDSTTTDDELELINTDVILQHNADLLSELLPLPQLTVALEFGRELFVDETPKLKDMPLLSPRQRAVLQPNRLSREYLDDAAARLGLYQLKPVSRLETTFLSLNLEGLPRRRYGSLPSLGSSLKKKSLVLTEKRTLVLDHSLSHTKSSDYALLFGAGDDTSIKVKKVAQPPLQSQDIFRSLHLLSSVECKHLRGRSVPQTQTMEVKLMRGLIMELVLTERLWLQLPVRQLLPVIQSQELVYEK